MLREATKDASLLKEAAAVGGIFSGSLPSFTNISGLASLTLKQVVVRLYINATDLSIIGNNNSLTHSFVGNELSLLKVSVTYGKLTQVFQAFVFFYKNKKMTLDHNRLVHRKMS